LNLVEEEEGCGTEYGRHSKSIDPAKQRCGRCRGVLRQVRPRPRPRGLGSDAVEKRRGTGVEKGASPSKKRGEKFLAGLERAMEVVTIGED
jgi:SprT-like zinc ribbon domain